MKKLIFAALVLSMCMSFAACGSVDESSAPAAESSQPTSEAQLENVTIKMDSSKLLSGVEVTDSELLDKITEFRTKVMENAEEKERALKAKKEQLEKQQEAWRERSQQLAQSEKNLALWQAKQKDFGLLETEFSRAEQTEKEYKTQKQTTEKRRLAYRAASLEFEE